MHSKVCHNSGYIHSGHQHSNRLMPVLFCWPLLTSWLCCIVLFVGDHSAWVETEKKRKERVEAEDLLVQTGFSENNLCVKAQTLIEIR